MTYWEAENFIQQKHGVLVMFEEYDSSEEGYYQRATGEECKAFVYWSEILREVADVGDVFVSEESARRRVIESLKPHKIEEVSKEIAEDRI